MTIKKPTESELEILQVLWQKGACTVRDVNDDLNQHRKVGYTTTLKLLQIMTEKGLVKRDESGRSHVYEAAVSEEKTQRSLLNNFMDNAFGGSAAKLIMQALGSEKTSPEELREIRNFLDKLEPQKEQMKTKDRFDLNHKRNK